ncbi:MFS transporter [Solemya velesiana gill symbiont]|uniref:MFS transporter n=1 Tax=Solemya velesiana gill symbiont TaxID=1918948 RepID=A0A1T2KUG4_9GAMM|nr:MFS transporter [Solemya velesiana gill symbiont]OOZ36508.1 MFS transporter [Solemya velesiana gill symbiont]
MSSQPQLRLQFIVFALVAASFTNIYITQPVLPVLQNEFAADAVTVSYSVAAVILGIALANMPFGALVVALAGLLCAITDNLGLLIGARFVQGLFIPALTTCLAAFLARTLPSERLSVVMGSYVSATVIGGLGGRLLGGWIHPPLHWRYAFVFAAVWILIAGLIALLALPREERHHDQQKQQPSYWEIIKRWDPLRIYLVSCGSFFVFSSVFNYLPFRLEAPPSSLATEWITLLYLTYLMGVFIGPMAGKLSNRFGSAISMISGTLVLAFSMSLTLLSSIIAMVLALLGVCAGFFALHAAAVGTLNQRVTSGQGRANALYVLLYYLGGWIGITVCGLIYEQAGWNGAVMVCLGMLLIPLMIGITEQRCPNR